MNKTNVTNELNKSRLDFDRILKSIEKLEAIDARCEGTYKKINSPNNLNNPINDRLNNSEIITEVESIIDAYSGILLEIDKSVNKEDNENDNVINGYVEEKEFRFYLDVRNNIIERIENLNDTFITLNILQTNKANKMNKDSTYGSFPLNNSDNVNDNYFYPPAGEIIILS